MISLQYAAGFIDGEGSIGFSECRGVPYTRVTATNTNKEILEEFVSTFGGYIQKATRPKDKPNWKPAYHWTITHSKAVEFLDRIQKYLKIKSRQAECIFVLDAIRPGRSSPWAPELKDTFSLVKEQLNWLNKRGVHSEEEPVERFLRELQEETVAMTKKRKSK